MQTVKQQCSTMLMWAEITINTWSCGSWSTIIWIITTWSSFIFRCFPPFSCVFLFLFALFWVCLFFLVVLCCFLFLFVCHLCFCCCFDCLCVLLLVFICFVFVLVASLVLFSDDEQKHCLACNFSVFWCRVGSEVSVLFLVPVFVVFVLFMKLGVF